MSNRSIIGILAAVIAFAICLMAGRTSFSAKKGEAMEGKARAVISEYLEKYKPLDLGLRRAWYEYSTTGDKRASARQGELELAMRQLASDRDRFGKLKSLYKSRDKIEDRVVRRQVELLYLVHLPNQVEPEKLKRLTALERRIEETFNDYRAELDGKKLSPVDVAHMLSDSTDSAKIERVWKSQAGVGRLLESDFRELVKLRNEIARDLGYASALELEAVVAELDLGMLDKFYSQVRKATDKPFKRLKEEYLDPRLAKRYNVAAGDLKPWHYQNAFFQEAPPAAFGKVDFDAFYAKTDSKKVVAQTIAFYESIGVDIKGIVKNSSLYPAPGKNPHAVAWLMDPEKPGSSVLIMNLPNPPTPPKASEASTLVHELGHDINYEAILANGSLPYLLREPTMLTEAFAMLMENQTQTADWVTRLGVPEREAREAEETASMIDYADQLIFLRWSSTIYCFERKFYADPDADIGDLWWECRARNQLLDRPEGWREPDALAKYHIPIVPPLYYSNYAIGRVANVQFAELFDSRTGGGGSASFYGRRELGDWLMKDFLAQGNLYCWDEFLKAQAGEPLSVAVWKRRYIGSDAEKMLYK
ncbi:MAG: M2 family metallopeptidase [bacterium]